MCLLNVHVCVCMCVCVEGGGRVDVENLMKEIVVSITTKATLQKTGTGTFSNTVDMTLFCLCKTCSIYVFFLLVFLFLFLLRLFHSLFNIVGDEVKKYVEVFFWSNIVGLILV